MIPPKDKAVFFGYEYKYEPRYIRSFCWIVVIVYELIEMLFAENKGDDCDRGLARLGG